jgi:hypothetical protein
MRLRKHLATAVACLAVCLSTLGLWDQTASATTIDPIHICPDEWDFGDYYLFRGYAFLLELGTLESLYTLMWYGPYDFPNELASGKDAILKDPKIQGTCYGHFVSLTEIEVYVVAGTATGTVIELFQKTTSPHQIAGGGGGTDPDGGTATEYCYFENYYDENWVFLYSAKTDNCWWEAT